MATGRLTLKPFAIVTELLYDRDRKRATGVHVLDAVTEQDSEYSAPLIFLCASALNSTWILMRSATDVWPGGLGSSSGELGHNLMDHHFRVGASGRLDEAALEREYYFGRRPTGFYIPRYRNLFGDRREYLRGFGYQGSASREGWQRAVRELGVGGDFKDRMARPGDWRIGATAFGEMLPIHENRVGIDESRTDKWGLPVLEIDCAIGENEQLMRVDMMNDMAETLEAAGVADVRTFDDGYAPGQGIHEMGTARMGRDPKTSVLNAWNQVWDAPNVFVTDGACMTSAACQNPSLTYMALTARAADHDMPEQRTRPVHVNRREVLASVAAMLGGGTLVGQAALLAGCERAAKSPPAAGSAVGLFSAAEVALLDEVAETILPETDTPGAKAAGVGPFMALMVSDCYWPAEQQTFRDGMLELDERSQESHGASFAAARPGERLALLERLDTEQHEFMQARPDGAPAHWFRMMKELALLGYFTSEIGYTQAMRYTETPGRYDPCTPYGPGERAWADHA